MKRVSEELNLARDEYITGYDDKQIRIFPTLALVAKEFNVSFSTLRKKAANEGWYKKRKHHQNSQEEFEIRKQFKGKYSKLAQISRNSLVFIEYFQNKINKEIENEKSGKVEHSIEDMGRIINSIYRVQRLAKEANDTLNNLENSFTELLD